MQTTLQQSNALSKVKDFAYNAHKNQFYPDGRRYFSHLETVAYLVEKAYQDDPTINVEKAITIAYLHDSIEDTNIDYIDVFNGFGMEIANDVSALTKDKSLPKKEQIEDSLNRILNSSKETMIVKLADRIANLQQTIFLNDHKWTLNYKEYYKEEAKLINEKLGHSSAYLFLLLNVFIKLY